MPAETSVVVADSSIPRSLGVYDPALRRFIDSVTRKPIGEVDTEEYLEKLREVHSQLFGTKPNTEKTIYPNSGNQGTKVTASPTGNGSFTTTWGSYLPYSSPAVSSVTDATPEAEQQREVLPGAEQQREVLPEAERKREVLPEAERKESTMRTKQWHNFIFKKEYENEPIWYNYKKSRSLWDGIRINTPALSTSRTPPASSEPCFKSACTSKPVLTMTSGSREDCSDGLKFQDFSENVKEFHKNYIWQSLLCCCRQQDVC